MVGRKIFPQSVRLDEIKTARSCETRARRRDAAARFAVFFPFGSGVLAAPVVHVVAAVTGGESLFLLVCSGHWHAARQYVASPREPCRLARTHTRTHSSLHLRHVSGCLRDQPPPTPSPPHLVTLSCTPLNTRPRRREASTAASWKFASGQEVMTSRPCIC